MTSETDTHQPSHKMGTEWDEARVVSALTRLQEMHAQVGIKFRSA